MQPKGMVGGLLVSGTDLMEVVKELHYYLMETRGRQQDWCRKHCMVVAGNLDMVEAVLLGMAAARMIQVDWYKMVAVVAGGMAVAADDQVVEAVGKVAEGNNPGGEGCSGVLAVGCYDMVGEVVMQSLEVLIFMAGCRRVVACGCMKAWGRWGIVVQAVWWHGRVF